MKLHHTLLATSLSLVALTLSAAEPATDGRIAVHFPAELRTETLRNMRDHLLALQQMQDALARSDFERVRDIAENRLGMSSMKAHGAHHVAQHMPEGMQAIGSAMHRSASRLATEAANASASNNPQPVLAALATLTQQCVACHTGYRLE
jgi:cytochrome c556